MSTHRTRLARALAAILDIGYQPALARVITAAHAGRLPTVLDDSGMRQALDLLVADARTGTTVAPPRRGEQGNTGSQPCYHRLVDVTGKPLAAAVARRVGQARAAGVTAAVCHGPGDSTLWEVTDDDPNPEGEDDEWQRLVAEAGPRDCYALPEPYPPGSTTDGYLPIDRALDTRDATGDIDAYERSLRRITRAEPRDVDAWAHLGNLYLAMADPAGTEIVYTPQPPASQRRAWLRTALGYYQTGVAVGELALPDPFDGRLAWIQMNNRPFLRALHGLAIALWRLARFDAAQRTLHNMLLLNPDDNQGARFLLPPVRGRRAWTVTDDG